MFLALPKLIPIAIYFSPMYIASVQMENQICNSTSSYRTQLCGGNVFAGRERETEEPLSQQHLPLQISTVSRRPSRAARAASMPPWSSRCWAHSSPPPPRSATGIDLKIFATREDVTFVSGDPFPLSLSISFQLQQKRITCQNLFMGDPQAPSSVRPGYYLVKNLLP